MGCGTDMLSYILMRTWCTLLVLVIMLKIGSLLRFPGALLLNNGCCENCNVMTMVLCC